MSPVDPAPRRRRKEARPQELLEAALALFVEKGFAATRTEEVAERAGVSKGTLYLYFSSKEELLKAVIRHTLAERIAAGAALAALYPGSTAALMRGPLVDWWCALYDSPASGVFKLIITEARNFPDIAQMYAREVAEPADRLLFEALQRGVDRGEFRPVDIVNAGHSLVLPLVMVCLHRHSLAACPVDWGLDAHGFIRQHIELVLQGLLARGPAPADAELPQQPASHLPNRPQDHPPAAGAARPLPPPPADPPDPPASSTSQPPAPPPAAA